jgi:hypothetical protein
MSSHELEMGTREVKSTICHPLAVGGPNLSQQYPNSKRVGIKIITAEEKIIYQSGPQQEAYI